MTTRVWLAAWGTGAVFIAIAAFIAVDTTYSGDNYCGRLYFDTQWNSACRTTLAVRAGWFLALAGAAVALAVGLVVSARRPRVLAASALGAVALIGVLVGFNRLLQPIAVVRPIQTQFCGSVLNRHTSPFDGTYNRTCNDLLGPRRRAAMLAFGVAAVSGAGATATVVRTSRRPAEPGSGA